MVYMEESGRYTNIISENEGQHSNKNWEMNYLEASIFLEEGENNDKFNSHPRDRSSLPAYLITHKSWFYLIDLFASLLLLFLAVMEPPAVHIFKGVPIGVHSCIELFGLAIIGISIAMQVRWLGWKTFIRHKRSMIKSTTWIIMVVEAVAVLARNTTHFRVTRSLRPIFLVDNRYLGGVRRFLRQILQSMPPILEVLGLLLFTLVIFAVFGFYLFSSNPADPYFSSFYLGFISLYVLLTTANYPDVMMPAYAKNKWSALFFIAYLAITLYFIMSLMLAIVFVEFSSIEKDKFRKLLLHKREACQYAFNLLVTTSQPHRVSLKNFEGLMRVYKPKASRRDVYLVFKALSRSKAGYLSLKEFYGIYDALELNWNLAKGDEPWFIDICEPFRSVCFLIRKLVLWKWFKVYVYFVIIVSGFILLGRTMYISSNGSENIQNLQATWDQLACIIFYVIEVILKLIAFGVDEYFSCGWNVFDFLVTTLSVGGIVAQYFNAAFFYIVILRPLRLLRLFRIRRRYRDIYQTLSVLLPRILSAVIVIIIIYYFFAIIGMELFADYDMKNCCLNTTAEQYYREDNTTIYSTYYYLNNFSTLLISGVTLFELTVVNNWFIIMEGYASVSGEWSRLYFMIFYLVMMVVLSVVVAFIIEAVTFQMQYNETFKGIEKGSESLKIQVNLTKEELAFVYCEEKNIARLQDYAIALNGSNEVVYEGVRRRTKVVLQRRMYSELISSWLRDHKQTVILPRLLEQRASVTSLPSPSDPLNFFSGVPLAPPMPDSIDDLLIAEDPFFPSSIQNSTVSEDEELLSNLA